MNRFPEGRAVLARQACAGMAGRRRRRITALNRDSRSLPSLFAWQGLVSDAAVARVEC
ncbi:hypothetical protein F8B43_0436 [Methylorubrum populi]|uniref:Uncharacterized protein n=1 Tax=Methylorubrum populi TaxID=223967 RepID=A0A833J9I2_9HYPH|nr:hypothetical protein F8B43_0436 [Methylorubrum populi]